MLVSHLRHLLRPLSALFSPEIVAVYDEESLSRIAAESGQTMARRKRLLDLHRGLIESLAELNMPMD
jgi:hypothetical protein